MKQPTSTRLSRIMQTLGAAALLAATCMILQPASAGAAFVSAGNTIIRNQVSVSYADSLGVAAPLPALSNVVEVTVTTTIAAPKIGAVTPSPGTTGALGATQLYSVEVITTSTGPGTVTLSAADGSPINMAVSGTTPAIPITTAFLGSTTFDFNDPNIGVAQNIAAGGTILIRIPNDGGVPSDTAAGTPAVPVGAFGDGIVNGLKALDTVYIYDGTTRYGKFSVTTVTDNAKGAGTTAAYSTILLTNATGAAIPAFTPQYDWQIVEAKNLDVTVTQGALSGTNTTGSWVTTFTGTVPGPFTGTGTVTTNASVGKIDVKKYVRNVTAAVAGATPAAGVPAIISGGTYYQTGVSGKPGEVLEYLYIINNAGAALVKNVIATDPVPIYTKLLSSSAAYGANNLGGATGTFAQVVRSGLVGTLQSIKVDNSSGLNTVAWGKSAGTAGGSTMTFYLGNNSNNGGNALSGGEIAAAETVYVVYQLTID